ncbi:MAG: phenylalanine--tRNA ligase subunit beta [Rhodospirillaceae bacterium]
MKFTLSWLKDHLDTDSDLETISDTLTAIGLEVEEVLDPRAALASFVVAEIVSAEQHPDADRLKLCKVSTGKDTVQVVCGAPNARAGLKGVLARPGDIIPATGDKLKKGKIRGVESQGMMCSASELLLGEDDDGIIELDSDVTAGTSAADALALEPVIDVALTPNRVDALGVRGVARDLAAAELGTLKPIDTSSVAGTFDSEISVAMRLPDADSGLCPHFVGRTIRGVKNCESPQWLKDRLTAVGLRPVSALVDITQYINIDLGRPLHAFDASKLSGDVGPRLATKGEKIAALNGNEYTLSSDMLVIADETGAQAIAGVMGGEPSSCTDLTTEVFLESALFDPITIANTGRALGIVSDARYCFERGVDPASTLDGAEVATRIIIEICGGEASHLVVGGVAPEIGATVSFRPARIKDLGGVVMDATEIQQILARLGFVVESADSDVWTVKAPTWRRDVEGEHDLVEEVLRIHGYDAIPVEPLPRPAVSKPAFTDDQRRAGIVRRALAGQGLSETTTWSFLAASDAELFATSGSPVVLQNPISSDLDVMRPSLLPNLISAAGRNAARAMSDVALFEVGPRFEGDAPGEQTLVAGGMRAGQKTPRHWNASARVVDIFDAKADALAALEAVGVQVERLQIGSSETSGPPTWYHPGQSGTLCLGPNVLAEFGALHPLVLKGMDVDGPFVGFEVFLDRIPKPKRKSGPARSKFAPSSFQPVERDFAFLLSDDVPVDDMIRAVRGADKVLIAGVDLFDVYVGDKVEDGKKSVALSVKLEPTKATLTDKEIEDVSSRIVAAVEKAVGGQLRK